MSGVSQAKLRASHEAPTTQEPADRHPSSESIKPPRNSAAETLRRAGLSTRPAATRSRSTPSRELLGQEGTPSWLKRLRSPRKASMQKVDARDGNPQEVPESDALVAALHDQIAQLKCENKQLRQQLYLAVSAFEGLKAERAPPSGCTAASADPRHPPLVTTFSRPTDATPGEAVTERASPSTMPTRGRRAQQLSKRHRCKSMDVTNCGARGRFELPDAVPDQVAKSATAKRRVGRTRSSPTLARQDLSEATARQAKDKELVVLRIRPRDGVPPRQGKPAAFRNSRVANTMCNQGKPSQTPQVEATANVSPLTRPYGKQPATLLQMINIEIAKKKIEEYLEPLRQGGVNTPPPDDHD